MSDSDDSKQSPDQSTEPPRHVCWKCSLDAHERCHSAPGEPACACPVCHPGF
ncbi:MAG TPA: hypothetical protein VLF67_00840 [Candidatus Saccharimonas sp.]|nr:hypothetical protein [Candidatus Saccharimonas sp.]